MRPKQMIFGLDRPRLQLTAAPQQKVRISGAEGMLTMLADQSPLGGAEADLLLTVVRPDGHLFYALGTAPQADFAQLRSVFLQMVSSLRFDP